MLTLRKNVLVIGVTSKNVQFVIGVSHGSRLKNIYIMFNMLKKNNVHCNILNFKGTRLLVKMRTPKAKKVKYFKKYLYNKRVQ